MFVYADITRQSHTWNLVYTNWYFDIAIYFYSIAAFHRKIVMRSPLPVLVYKSKYHIVKQIWLKSTSLYASNGNKTYFISILLRVHVEVPVVYHQISQVHIYEIWYTCTCKTHNTRTHHTHTHTHNTRAYTWTVSFTLSKVRILDILVLNYYFELM